MSRIACIVFFALLVVPCISNAETIDVQIKGVDDGAKTTKQRDYKEAVLFAKREAIERAGVKIKSMTTVKDLVVNSDYIESEAEAVLLPGYNILDMGYSADGTYQIVLVGKVKTVSEGIDSKELRYAKSLMERGEKSKARKIVADIIKNSKDDNAVAEAIFCEVLWKFTSDERDAFEKLKAYYPNSKYVSRLKAVLVEREKERKRLEAERKQQELRELGIKTEEVEGVTAWNDRFVAFASGIVRDTKTGLEWIVGPHRDMSWYESKSWAESLTFDGGGWRLPTLKELERMYERGRMAPFLKFKGEGYVWSADTMATCSDGRLRAYYFTGSSANRILPSDPDYKRALAVRSLR